MDKSEKVHHHQPETIDLEFLFPIDRTEDLTMLLMDLGWIKFPEQAAMLNEKTGQHDPLPFDIDRFWERYNDPDRLRFTEEMLDEYLESEKITKTNGQ